jgi:sec-independent protein translocase protein TatB
MNFLGVGPFELILILVLGLVVLGPERLRSMGRSAGKLVAQLLAWQQQSPEAQMVQQIRADFEREIVDLRDELVRARQQLDVSAEVQRLREETGSIMPDDIARLEARARASMPDATDAEQAAAPAPDHTEAAPAQPPTEPEPARAAEAPAAPEPAQAAETPAEAQQPAPAPSDTAHANGTTSTHPAPPDAAPDTPPHSPEAPPAPPDELAPTAGVALPEHVAPPDVAQEHLAHQLQALVADMHALQEQLRRRGLLDAAWEPPSAHGTPPVEHETLSSR